MPSIKQTAFHRMQLGKAQKYIRDNLHKNIDLSTLARASGASPYHFIRVFSAYTSETPFEFIRRQKILASMEPLRGDDSSITDIAFSTGYSSSSAYTKAFKAVTKLAPKEFRNFGKENARKLVQDLSISPKVKEIEMELDFELNPTIVTRPKSIIIYNEDCGPFEEIAPSVWEKFLEYISKGNFIKDDAEFLGISDIKESESGHQKHFYKAAVTINNNSGDTLAGSLKYGEIPPGKYAKFILNGSYLGLWPAFKKAFAYLNENNFELNNGPCLENYLNDPKYTPEDELITEILIPVK